VSQQEDAFKKQFDWALTRRILRHIWPYRWVALGALALSFLIAGASQSFPYLQRQAIDRYLAPSWTVRDPGPSGLAEAQGGREARREDASGPLTDERQSHPQRIGRPATGGISYSPARAGSPFLGLSVDARLHGVAVIAALYFVVAVVEFLSRFGFQYSLTWLGQHVLFDLRAAVFQKLHRLPLAYFDRNPVGRLMTRVTSDVDAINSFITNGLVTVAQSIFVLLAVLTYMFVLDVRLALVASLAIPLIFVATRFFQTRFRDAYRVIRQQQAVVNTALNENIVGMGTVQLFNREARNRRLFDGFNREFLNANLTAIHWYSFYFPTVGFISHAALAAIVWYGGGRTVQQLITVGTLFAFTQYVRNFFQPLQDLADVFNTLQAAMASAERIFGVLDEPETVQDVPATKPVDPFRGEVELDDVWFSYKPVGAPVTDEDWVLRGINLNVKAGESVALVGATGAGKTSIISLVSRFYDVQKGRVRVDGVDVRELSQRELRRHVAVVLQDVFLFAGTIESNLRLNDESIPFARLEEACRYLGVHEMIMRLPQGYQTEVKERGATLSAGQKQLLAFARALVVNPEILLVLDEATANVDTETEHLLQEAQEKLMRNRTSLIIAHRLSTIRHCDRIVVLRRGQIVEEGSHEALLARGGYYATLHNLQYAEEESQGRPLSA
jgi:ATP-binding cassette subfamily B protein